MSKNNRFETLCDYRDAYIVVKEITDLLAAAANKNDKNDEWKLLRLETMIHLDHAFQKLTVHYRQCRRTWYSHADVYSVRA